MFNNYKLVHSTLDLPALSRLRERTRVVYIWVMVMVACVIVAFLWFLLNEIVSTIFSSMMTMYPTSMSNPAITFVYKVWLYFPPIALLGIGLWAYVQSQKPPGTESQ